MSARDISQFNPLGGQRGRPISADRAAVEAVMQASSVPLPADKIALRCGIKADDVRVIVRNCCTKGLAHNAAPGAPIGLYAWGPAPVTQRPAGAAGPRGQIAPVDQFYRGLELRPFDCRPGAMDAFTHPSLVNGERVARVRPVIISAKPELKR